MRTEVARPIAVVAAICTLIVSVALGTARPAAAAAGEMVADVLVPEAEVVWARGLAPSVAFDGRYLYYLDYAGSVLHRIDAPPPGASVGTGHVDFPIVGAPPGIMTVAYDAGRNSLW